MLPPVDSLILSTNPKFNALYSDLCNNKLNRDGTSKLDAKAQRDHDTLKEDLHQARVEAASRDLIKSGLQELSYRPDALPEALQQLVTIVAAVLDGQIADEDRYLLQDDLKKFQDNVKQISSALAKLLEQDTSMLAGLTTTGGEAKSQDLSATVRSLKGAIAADQTKLHESRLVLAQEVTKLHEVHRQVIERSIRILEQTIHGSVARGVKAKADYLALVAEGMNKKVELQHGQLMSQLYTLTFQQALQTKLDELQEASRAAKRKVREAEDKLGDYKKVQGMDSLAQEYAEVLKETEKVQSDIARLEKGRD